MKPSTSSILTNRLKALLFSCLVLVASIEAQAMNSLSELQWKNRVLLIKAPDDGSRAMETLARHQEGIADRDIAWFVATEGDIRSNLQEIGPSLAEGVRELLGNQPGQSSVVLIGKDGGVKDHSDQLDLERLFSKIDRMPMRIREMRQKE